MTGPTVSAEDSGATIYDYNVSDLQTDVSVVGGKITGTLHKQTTGSLVSTYGEGYFIALKWANVPSGATSLKVGFVPSMGTGLVEAISDPDHNLAGKVTNKETQKFVVYTSDGNNTHTDVYDLSDLVLEA